MEVDPQSDSSLSLSFLGDFMNDPMYTEDLEWDDAGLGPSTSQQASSNNFKEVKKKDKKFKKKDKKEEKHTEERRARGKPPAILIKMTRELTFEAALRKLKEDSGMRGFSEDVTSVRRTDTGDLLVELAAGSTKVEEIRHNMAKVLGEKTNIAPLAQRVRVAIYGLDELVNETELKEAIQAELGRTADMSILIRPPALRGQRMAVVSLLPADAEAVTKKGKIRVGFVGCRTRKWVSEARCFRCLGSGHTAKECKGKDRAGCCRACGKKGHKAADCSAPPEMKEKFKRKLDRESKKKEHNT